MKKFYMFLMAAAIIGSASAANPVVKLSGNPALKTLQPSKSASISTSAASPKTSGIVKAIRKADAAKTIQGLWTFYMGDYYFQTSTNSTLTLYYEATIYDENLVVFESLSQTEPPFFALYDETESTLTFDRKFVATTTKYYIYQQPFVYNYETKDLDSQTIVGTYSADKGYISFHLDNGIAWEAYTDKEATNLEGYYRIYDLEAATHDSDEDSLDEVQEGKWKSLGNATFIDAWVIPAYYYDDVQLNPNDYPYEVELQQNVDNENIYRLWKPYTNGNFYLKAQNKSPYQGQIQFDLTDPDNVIVIANDMPAGFNGTGREYYMTNELGWYLNYYGDEVTIDEILDWYFDGPDGYDPDTFKDGIITIHNTVYDYSPKHDKGFELDNNPYYSIVKFPGTGVDAIDSDTVVKARYYNLQGVEVAAPADGIFIKVEGSKTTKVVR